MTSGTRDSGAGDGGARDGGTGDASTGDGGAGDASTREVPTFKATSPAPFDVRADTADDFVSNANAGMGGVVTGGHMKPTINRNLNSGPMAASQKST